MTLCIGAIARHRNKFIAVCDFMLGNDIMSAEPTTTKVSFIGKQKRWAVMFAGDPTHAWSVTQRVINKLKNTNETFPAMCEAWKASFVEELEQKINDELLSPYGMNRKEFIQGGKAAFGEEIFGKMLYQIADTGLETEFLVGNSERLFSITDPGVVQYHDSLGFHAIGTGALLARASLMGTLDVSGDEPEEIIYKLLEAKFRGESAAGVGKKTVLMVLNHPSGQVEIIFNDECQKIRGVWEAKGRPTIPPEAIQSIKDSIKPLPQIKPIGNPGEQ
jgi:ATP-dependent protease HslVU (ClpYQ) peptidase subunit